MASNKVPLIIEYKKPGTNPPIYLAGSFSDPPWHPEEMEPVIANDSDGCFRKEVTAKPGEDYQYKFRIGDGDWWVLNENAPSATDDAGNRNNVISVPSSRTASEIETSRSTTHGNQPESTSNNFVALLSEVDSSKEDRDPYTAKSEPDSVITPSTQNLEGHSKTSNRDQSSLVDKMTMTPKAKAVSDSTDSNDKRLTGDEMASKDISLPSHTSAATAPLNQRDDEKRDQITTPIPEVVVEKIDDAPVHGDDFGPSATQGQKEAHDMRVKDAKPDHVVIVPDHSDGEQEKSTEPSVAGNMVHEYGSKGLHLANIAETAIEDRRLSSTPIPEVANTAAEVADIAATLDVEELTPPLSDEEAGKIGYRRLSSTPIQQVAKTAAEVADSAAMMDGEGDEALAEESHHLKMMGNALSSGPPTPAHEHVPLFAHECFEPNYHTDNGSDYADDAPIVQNKHDGDAIDVNDPTIERFPTDRNLIYTHFKSAGSRLDEDKTVFSGTHSSPARRYSEQLDLPLPVSQLHDFEQLRPAPNATDRSPSLVSIPEEQPESEQLFDALPSPTSPVAKATYPSSEPPHGNSTGEDATPVKAISSFLANSGPLDEETKIDAANTNDTSAISHETYPADAPRLEKDTEGVKSASPHTLEILARFEDHGVDGDVSSKYLASTSESKYKLARPSSDTEADISSLPSGGGSNIDPLTKPSSLPNITNAATNDGMFVKDANDDDVADQAAPATHLTPAHTNTDTSSGAAILRNRKGALEPGEKTTTADAAGVDGVADDVREAGADEADAEADAGAVTAARATTDAPTTMGDRVRRFFSAIWETVFVGWLGGLRKRLLGSGGDSGNSGDSSGKGKAKAKGLPAVLPALAMAMTGVLAYALIYSYLGLENAQQTRLQSSDVD